MMSVLRRAYALLTIRFLLLQLGLAFGVFVLFVVWLRIPDAKALDIAISAVLGILVLGIAMVGEAALLRPKRSDFRPRRLLQAALILTIAALLWLAWSALIDSSSVHDVLRAGYLNSRFPHAARNVFSYPHLLLWFGWLWISLRWLGAAVLLAFAIGATQEHQLFKPGFRLLRSIPYWFVLLSVFILINVSTQLLLSWTPGHGLTAEMISLILRLGLIVIVDLTLCCFMLTTGLALIEMRYATPAGTPDMSHERTVEHP